MIKFPTKIMTIAFRYDTTEVSKWFTWNIHVKGFFDKRSKNFRDPP